MRDFMEQDGEGGEEPNLKIILKNVQFTLLFFEENTRVKATHSNRI